ncbi:methionine aminopeptidase, type I [Kwoniella bestiolae CBS 10118]|uniref:Methionine aminopeptidase n=1 Tax=Kwoniella bestiolae CBS 10118 TaxID=1296100 RepID=A0A1B9G2N2_9TREE|nr:methionine aminopeptidase, type I [Kwoniella bestiolae CBS 10118]OCF25283.1 methionine aminopeptidase, type I [Kwoniella bestiolae CBS 10118]
MLRPTLTLLNKFPYTPGPSKYGTYPLLPPSFAMTSYPPIRPVPRPIPRPEYVPGNFFTADWGGHDTVEVEEAQAEGIQLGGEGERRVREVAGMAGDVLREVGRLIRPGITTNELDKAVHDLIIYKGAYPSPLGYSSYPRSCTTSINNVIAHGIPDDRPLHPEDIINIDLTLFYKGYHGDTSATFVLPDVDRQGRELVEATKEALQVGIKACRPGRKYQDIGREIEDFAKRHGFSVNGQFSGHGIGKVFHRPPWIFHTRNSEPGEMAPGDCITIEPCLIQGRNARGELWDDGWTMVTESGARSAQFEHQVLITEDGVDVLTRI